MQVHIECSVLIGCRARLHAILCPALARFNGGICRRVWGLQGLPTTNSQKVATPIRPKARTKCGWPGPAMAGETWPARGAKRHGLCYTLGPVPYSTWWHVTLPRAVPVELLVIIPPLLPFRHVAKSAGTLEFHPQDKPRIFKGAAEARSLHHNQATEAWLVNQPTHWKTCNPQPAGETYFATPVCPSHKDIPERDPKECLKNAFADTSVWKSSKRWQLPAANQNKQG